MVVMVVMTVIGTGEWWSKVSSVLSSGQEHITHAQNHLSFRLLLFDTSKQVFSHVIEIGVLGSKVVTCIL